MLRARDADVREMMDEPQVDAGALRHSLRDLRRINGLLGWRRMVVRTVARTVEARGSRGSFSLVDVASGSGDMPLAVARWARRRGITARIVVTDVNPEIVMAARAFLAETPGIAAERQDALALSYPDGSFDIALCTLALHHFAPDDAVGVLREMGRVGRQVLVFDLVRSPLAFVGAVVLTHLPGMEAMTGHDGPASVRRAYTAPELRELARQAGLRDGRVSVRFPFRLTLEA
ncbi:MAG TPA: methyltransferase domain-containing protein [Ktedonobacterales bacterium]|nr:methyltransferase domain-containing protein [Ktedonobacterales bacterium]